MGRICTCPEAEEITDIPTELCLENFGQTVKVAFQRVYASAGVLNEIVIATTNPNLKATWTALQAASDSTKVTISPFIQNPETEPGAKREVGGGNATVGGIPIVLGAEATTFSGNFARIKQNVIAAIKEYGCENLGVYLINNNGKMAGVTDDVGTPTLVRPFPVQGFFVGDKKLGGFEDVDSNAVSWAFPENWSDFFHVIDTLFDASTEL